MAGKKDRFVYDDEDVQYLITIRAPETTEPTRDKDAEASRREAEREGRTEAE